MNPIILTHGGVGDRKEKRDDGCVTACETGMKTLKDGKADAALRAVIEAAVVLEDDPRFNAGTGANLRVDGSLELDASLGTSDGRIASLACLRSTKNPIRVANALLDSPHVMLCGDGATRFARARGFPEANMISERALTRWKAAVERVKSQKLAPWEKKWKGRDITGAMHGTIGAVARAADGTFAVSCSTGGTSLMLPGRIGDTPVWGAGIYCGPLGAVCATGTGEEVIRRHGSLRVYMLLEKGMSAQEAAEAEVKNFPEGYEVGYIVVDKNGYGIAATNDEMPAHALELK
ncbi:MAG: isoaspartyl peptidase/L-asparaginase [Planctomycetes bacterium]|nr:isoaspartyl peptidase/L-asparaginase [Planctomycetota bacterium]